MDFATLLYKISTISCCLLIIVANILWNLLLGPYIFVISVGTYLVSKEIYILEHEFYNGLSLMAMYIYSVKKFGPKVAAMLDKEIDKVEESLNQDRNNEMAMNEELIVHEKQEQSSLDGQKMIMDIKKENIKMQLEATYRERMVQVYQEV